MEVSLWHGHFKEYLNNLKCNGGYRFMRVVEDVAGPWMTVKGSKLLQFASNDYLGLTQHARLRKAAEDAMQRFGVGVGASRLVSGNYAPLEELEQTVAEFKGCEAALVFSSGYTTNVGVISALVSEQDRIVSDELNHASIVDGCRLSRAMLQVYRHRNLSDLEELLSRPHRTGRTLVITDGVFSMDGDVAPLGEIVRICNHYGALLMVDDAHGTGVLGDGGRGSTELWGVEDPHIIQVGTFSKALGGLGGFVAGSMDLIDYLKNRVRTLIYSTGLPSGVAAANREALKIIDEEPQRRIHLKSMTRRLRDGLSNLGFPQSGDDIPIAPLIIGEANRTLQVSQDLLKAGILAPAIRPPSVPDGTSRIRLSLMALHQEEHVDRLLESIKRVA